MEMESCVPPGFRFHPTEEELVGYYLKRKIYELKIDLSVIIEIDLYKMEPWDIQARCKLGYEAQSEWYFFSYKDRKYPTGTRTNRATAAGFWKATGRDKVVLSKNKVIGMRKTLVFYKGRAPNGRKTDWIMHEYRLQTSEHGPPQEEGWVVCRAFKKPIPNQRPGFEAWNNAYGIHKPSQVRRPFSSADTIIPNHTVHPDQSPIFHQTFGSEPDPFVSHPTLEDNQQFIELPRLDSPSAPSTSFTTNEGNFQHKRLAEDYGEENVGAQFINWKNLDNMLALQANEYSTSFSNGLQDLPSIPPSSELESQDHVSHVLGCFPDF